MLEVKIKWKFLHENTGIREIKIMAKKRTRINPYVISSFFKRELPTKFNESLRILSTYTYAIKLV